MEAENDIERKILVGINITEAEVDEMKRISGVTTRSGAILSLARKAVRDEHERVQRAICGLPM